MSIRDSKYTNPESLRLLYTSPRNPLRDLDDVTNATQTLVEQGPAQPPGGSGGGGNPPDPPGGCPEICQFTDARGASGGIIQMYVHLLAPGVDELWNAITRTFRLVTAAELVENVDCVMYRTRAGAESIVSLSHPAIQSFLDDRGKAMQSMLEYPDAVHAAVASINGEAIESEIEWIRDAGKRSVVRISLEGGGIYGVGSKPRELNLGHNVKPGGQGGGGGE